MNEETTNEEVFRKERLLFRFVNLSQQGAEELRETWRDKLEITPYRGTGHFVVCLELREGVDYAALIDFVTRQGLPEDSYGLYCSVVTEHSVDGIHVPHFAVQLFRQTGGTIDFSCTGI